MWRPPPGVHALSAHVSITLHTLTSLDHSNAITLTGGDWASAFWEDECAKGGKYNKHSIDCGAQVGFAFHMKKVGNPKNGRM